MERNRRQIKTKIITIILSIIRFYFLINNYILRTDLIMLDFLVKF